MGEPKKIKVLVVDDEQVIRDFFRRLLGLEGLEVMAVEDGYKAVELARRHEFDLFFIDLRMPGLSGLETYLQIGQIRPQAKMVMITGYSLEGVCEQLKKEPAWAFIRKPFDIAEIKGIVNEVSAKKDTPEVKRSA